MSIITKVCGITRRQDLHVCAESGVDWIGLNRWPKSPRYVEADVADGLSREARQLGLTVVGLYVAPTAIEVERVWDSGLFDLLQLYQLDVPLPDGVLALEPIAVQEFSDLQPSMWARFQLYETRVKQLGGAGRTFDWTLLPDQLPECSFIAGGLTPGNVSELLGRVQPYGIDVASGVESSPGLKDRAKVRKLVEEVRRATRSE